MKKKLISISVLAAFIITSLSACGQKPAFEKNKYTTIQTSAVTKVTETEEASSAISTTEASTTTSATTTTVKQTTTTAKATTTVVYSAPKRSEIPVEASSYFKNISVDYDYINYNSATIKVEWDKIRNTDKYHVYVDLLGFTCDSTYKTEGTGTSYSVNVRPPVIKDDKLYVRLAAEVNGKYEMYDFIFDIRKKTMTSANGVAEVTTTAKTTAKKTTTKAKTPKVTTTAPKTTTKTTTTKKITTTTKKAPASPNSAYYNPTTGYTYLGSAGALDGKTAVVSIFADSGDCSWDFSNSQDKKTAKTMCDYLGIATDWMEEQSRLWGKNADFIYDWNKYPQLKYEAKLDADFYDNNDYANWYYDSWEYVDKHIDSLDIKKDLNVDNLIYLMFFNSPIDSQIGNSARGYYEGMPYSYEIAWIHCARRDNITQPAAIAHEMLHLFGATDLYLESDKITQKYVEYTKDHNNNDIMYTTYEDGWKYRYDTISNDISEITAYYIGWTDSCSDVKTYGLAKSQHLPYIK